MQEESYITTEMAREAIRSMRAFHDDLQRTMSSHGIDLLANLGRRNILLSQAQEKFFAEAIGKRYDVQESGRTGEPDIYVRTLDRELECKLASPQSNGSIGLQTDYETLLRKGKLDYLYVVADESFESFAVFHYTDLTADDFGPMANGSRGKVQLLKHRAKDRLRPLIGSMREINHTRLVEIESKLVRARTDKQRDKLSRSKRYWQEQPCKFKIIMEKV
jgi:hypothetical protein